jgi:hypothetical protein
MHYLDKKWKFLGVNMYRNCPNSIPSRNKSMLEKNWKRDALLLFDQNRT